MRNDAIEPHPPTSSLVASICRCPPGQHRESSVEYVERVVEKIVEVPAKPSFDPKQFEILEVEDVAGSLVLKVRYTTCEHRAFEGVRVMVFLKARPLDAMKWRTIDPHFNKPDNPKGHAEFLRLPNVAPSPDARFPATAAGWSDALAYARSKGP